MAAPDKTSTPVVPVEPTNEFLWYVSDSSICEPAGTIAENLPKEVTELIVRTHNQEIEAFCRATTPSPISRTEVFNRSVDSLADNGPFAPVRESLNFISEVRPDLPNPSCHVCGALTVASAWKCSSCQATTGITMGLECDVCRERHNLSQPVFPGQYSIVCHKHDDEDIGRLCYMVNRILDGKDDGAGTCAEPWESVRRKLIALRLAAEAWVNRRTAASPEVKNDKQPETLSGCDRPRDNRLPTGRMDRTPTADHSIHEKGRLAGSNNSGTDVQDHAQIAESAPSPVSREPISAELLELLRQILPATTRMPHHGIFCKAGKKGLDPTKDGPQCTCAHSSFKAIQRAEEILRESD